MVSAEQDKVRLYVCSEGHSQCFRHQRSGQNKTVIEIVEKCLEGTDLTFEVKGNAIVIKKLERPLVTVSGWVRDSDGEALVGATVMIRGSKKGAIVGLTVVIH